MSSSSRKPAVLTEMEAAMEASILRRGHEGPPYFTAGIPLVKMTEQELRAKVATDGWDAGFVDAVTPPRKPKTTLRNPSICLHLSP